MTETSNVDQPVSTLLEFSMDIDHEMEGYGDEVEEIQPTRDDLVELLEAWTAEDRQGDPEEQQRSLDLLMRLLDEDHF